MIAASKSSPMITVLASGRAGFEAFDINECTVGTFASQCQAADAICERQTRGQR
jgi:hypothetical protein